MDDADFEAWLSAVTERLDPFMAWLGVVFALIVGYEIAVPLRPPAAQAFSWIGWALWAVFAGDYLAKLYIAPSRGRFVRRHCQAAFLVLPTLRLVSFVRLLRIGRALPGARVLSSSYRVAGSARHVLRSRLSYLAALGVIAVIAEAEAVFLLDGGRGHVFPTFGDAMLWSLAVVVGMQGDPTPTSVGGRLVMVVGFAAGAVVIATLAGIVGAFLLEARDERRVPANDRRRTG